MVDRGPLPDPAYVGYRLGSLAARLLPRVGVEPASEALGRLAARLMRSRRHIVERTIRRVHGDLPAAEVARHADAVFASYARYWIESFRLPDMSPDAIAAGMRTEGLDVVESALSQGNGAILALPHLGGWEWAAFWMARIQGHGLTAVVEPVEPPELADWFVGLRRGFGIQVVPLGPEAGAACVQALKRNDVLCLLCDRDIGGGGAQVDFFGERTTIPAGPATLALRTGAPLIPAAIYFDGPGHLGVAQEPLVVERQGRLRDDVARVSQDIADNLEGLIRRAPDQWHLMQPNWPSDLVG